MKNLAYKIHFQYFDAYLYKSSCWPFQNRHHSHRRSPLLRRYMLHSCRDPDHSHLSLKNKRTNLLQVYFVIFMYRLGRQAAQGQATLAEPEGESGFF